ncbi:MAG: DUF2061 domain-containing protein [Rhizobiales bacterium]|jgi:uncharacterized membrane protein|nr:DUF2061 domain-containing protein [Hyphomicrobiales bacterium]MDQ3561355.1 DUF2061 domain-containing protein [Pseudomonadota bacterium]
MTKEAREGHTRSFMKAVTWRVTGTVDTFILSLIITGSVKFAGSIAGTEVITKIFLYYFHERAWSYVSWGRGAKRQGDIAASKATPAAP